MCRGQRIKGLSADVCDMVMGSLAVLTVMMLLVRAERYSWLLNGQKIRGVLGGEQSFKQ